MSKAAQHSLSRPLRKSKSASRILRYGTAWPNAKYRFGKDRKVCSVIRAGKLSANNPNAAAYNGFPIAMNVQIEPEARLHDCPFRS